MDLALSVNDLFVDTCPLVLPVTLADTDRARELLPESVMLGNDVTEIASFDEGFDRIPGIGRLTLR